MTTARIMAELAEVEREHGIEVLFAAESGSRAWGHASPDSDYDVRFIYRRPLGSYLSVGKRRDCLELGMMDGDLDFAGWDIDKALRLLIGGNPAIFEWLVSPIVYRTTEWVERLTALAAMSPHRRAAHWHYRALARRQRELLGGDREVVKIKRYFYVIRPALACAWLAQNVEPGRQVPMDVPALLRGVRLHHAVRVAICDLMALKAKTAELGDGPRIRVLDEFFEAALDGEHEPPAKEPPQPLVEQADALLHEILGVRMTAQVAAPSGRGERCHERAAVDRD